MMGMLEDKVAVITGAGSGMAKASVKVFVREGAKVVAADISGAEQDTASEVGGDVLPVHCDVTKEGDVEALMAAAEAEFERVDVVLNVAGIADGCMLADLDMEMYDRLMDVDLRGVMLGMKHGIRSMLKTGGGSIVNWSSVGGLNGSRRYQCVRRGQARDHRGNQGGRHRVRHAGNQGERHLSRLHPDRDHGRGSGGLHPGHCAEGGPQPSRRVARGR